MVTLFELLDPMEPEIDMLWIFQWPQVVCSGFAVACNGKFFNGPSLPFHM